MLTSVRKDSDNCSKAAKRALKIQMVTNFSLSFEQLHNVTIYNKATLKDLTRKPFNKKLMQFANERLPLTGAIYSFYFTLSRPTPVEADVMSVCISYIMKISPITFQRHGVAAWTLRNRLLSCISFSWRTAISLPTNKWFISADRMYRACLHELRLLTMVSLMFTRDVITYGFF